MTEPLTREEADRLFAEWKRTSGLPDAHDCVPEAVAVMEFYQQQLKEANERADAAHRRALNFTVMKQKDERIASLEQSLDGMLAIDNTHETIERGLQERIQELEQQVRGLEEANAERAENDLEDRLFNY